jgi:hypothetical protein
VIAGRAWILALVVTLFGQAVLAQIPTAQGGGPPALAGPIEQESHGWIASMLLVGEDATLFHLPPRVMPGGGGAEAGVALQVRLLEELPSHVASRGRRVYLLYSEPERGVDVFSLRVSPTAAAAYWLTEPLQGAVSEPTLQAPGATLIDATCTPGGLLVLLRDEHWQLYTLGDDGWSAIDMPPGLAVVDEAWVRLIGGSQRPALLARYAGRTVQWELGAEGAWVATPLDGAKDWAEQDVLAVFARADEVCAAVRPVPLRVEIWSLGPALSGLVAGVDLQGPPAGVAPLEQGDRLAVLSRTRNESAAGVKDPVERWDLVEVSLATGRELSRGEPRTGAPISGSDVRWLSLGMGALMIGVLYYLLRPGPSSDIVTLPEGCALAEPGRRLSAGILDAVLIGAVIALAFRTPVQHVLLVAPLLETAGGVLRLGAMVALGTAYGTVCESLWGKTIGKALAGCEVVSVAGRRRRLGLVQSGARNLFKWGLAPWAALGLALSGGRHRGDATARAAVVVRVEEEGKRDGEEAPRP